MVPKMGKPEKKRQREKGTSIGNIAPGKQSGAPGGPNYMGGNYDPNYVPWARENREKGKGKGKDKGKGKTPPRSPLTWEKDLYGPEW